jgi:hypothetical protein
VKVALPGPFSRKRAHAVVLVLGVEQPGEQAGLQRRALREGEVQPLVDGGLGRGEGQRWAGGELLRHRHRGQARPPTLDILTELTNGNVWIPATS